MKLDLTPNDVALLSNVVINRTTRVPMDDDFRAQLLAVHRKLDEAYAADYEQRREDRIAAAITNKPPVKSNRAWREEAQKHRDTATQLANALHEIRRLQTEIESIITKALAKYDEA